MLELFLINIVGMSKSLKVTIQVFFDMFLICFILSLTQYTLTNTNFFDDFIKIFSLSLVFVFISFVLGSYKSFVRFYNLVSLLKTLFITLFTFSLFFFLNLDLESKPFFWAAISLCTFSLIILPRLILREQLLKLNQSKTVNVAILGNDYESFELKEILRYSKKFTPTCFITFNKRSSFSKLNLGLPEFNISEFTKIKSKAQVAQIIIPKHLISETNTDLFLEEITKLNIPLMKAEGVDSSLDLQNNPVKTLPLSLTDLEIRPPQKPIYKLLEKGIKDKSILVTGGGGSIGSELCRNILAQSPQKLIIIELNEFNLYKIEQDLEDFKIDNNCKTEIIMVLGSILDISIITKIFTNNQIDTIYHAAAFKHVPIVEDNAAVAFKNNVIGTKILAELSIKYKVPFFTLISTDKAVNPSNFMGATKRLAEMICLSMGKEKGNTLFTIVRFGNVLGSSGSVIPKFEKQIARGGPITVTHKNIVRYFMSLEEAVQLVIQASAMNKKNQIFVLDMGKPINILNLAKRMCLIRGLTSYCVDEGTFSGDIEILITGLRKSEKMYEEILSTKTFYKTEHQKIFSSVERPLSLKKIYSIINNIEIFLNTKDSQNLLKTFSSIPNLNYNRDNMKKLFNSNNY